MGQAGEQSFNLAAAAKQLTYMENKEAKISYLHSKLQYACMQLPGV